MSYKLVISVFLMSVTETNINSPVNFDTELGYYFFILLHRVKDNVMLNSAKLKCPTFNYTTPGDIVTIIIQHK